jgi:hypothetical protein
MQGRVFGGGVIALVLLCFGAGIQSAQSQSVIGQPQINPCEVAPTGAACAAKRQREADVRARIERALANPDDCEGLQAARRLTSSTSNDAFRLQSAWMQCRDRYLQAELERVRAPDAQMDDKARAPKAPPAKARAAATQPSLPDRFVDVPPPSPRYDASAQPDPFALPAPSAAPPRDPFANYKTYDRASSEVEVNVRAPGDPWVIRRGSGPEATVLSIDDLTRIDKAGEQLQMAGLQLEAMRLQREAQEREARRQAEEAARQRAIQAENERRMQEARAARERERRREEAQANWEIFGAIVGGLANIDAARRGEPPVWAPGVGYVGPGAGIGGYSNVPGVGGLGSNSGCSQRLNMAASKVASAFGGAGGGSQCANAQTLVRAYDMAISEISMCRSELAAEIAELEANRRQAQSAAQGICSNTR